MVELKERITYSEVEAYKREIMEKSVLVTPATAARILDRTERTVHNLIRDGKLHGYTENKRAKGLRLLASELRDYVESLKVKHKEWHE